MNFKAMNFFKKVFTPRPVAITLCSMLALFTFGCTDGCSKKDKSVTSAVDNSAPAAGEVKVEDIKVGDGAEVREGQVVTVHYTGTLTDGKKFDSSYDHGGPIDFPLDPNHIIKGWVKGISGMKVGGKRKMTIPPDLGYDASGMPPVIPPNSTLIFEVELLGVK